MRSALPALLLALGPTDGLVPGRLREALLREARERLTTQYALDPAFGRDGVQVRQSTDDFACGGKVPLTFGHFEVAGARPVDVFNALADLRGREAWDPTVRQVETVSGVWEEEEGVQGLEMLYPSGIPFVPDREVFEWAAYKADVAEQEFWVAYSTLGTARLQEALSPAPGAVGAENCLGAFWVRPAAGGSRVLFTQHVNVHPPLLLSARLVFAVSWGKQVDFIGILRQQALRQAKLGWADSRVAVAERLLREPVSGGAVREVEASFSRGWALARPSAGQPPRALGPACMLAAACLAAASGVLVLRRMARGQSSALGMVLQPEEASPLLAS